MATISETTTSVIDGEKFVGCVKWFNNKAGYGFITIKEGNKSGLDIFVHHSSINVENQQYKYLVQGEYVEFILVAIENSKYEYQASNVCGINAGKLMCETRRDFKLTRSIYKTPDINSKVEEVKVNSSIPEDKVKVPRVGRPSRVRGEGPRDNPKSEWTEVKKQRKMNTKKELSIKAI
jgi:cold shock CspA family protein